MSTPPGVPVVVALGANLGDRADSLAAAVDELRALPLTGDVRASPTIETVAVTLEGEDAAAPCYLNAVAVARTRLAPSVLLSALHEIEARHGRQRRARWGDRTLDLDLIAYGELRAHTPGLTVPHPRAAEREFVLEPWLAVDPDAELPGAGAVRDLLEKVRAPS